MEVQSNPNNENPPVLLIALAPQTKGVVVTFTSLTYFFYSLLFFPEGKCYDVA